MTEKTITPAEWLEINSLLLSLGDETSINRYSSILLERMSRLVRYSCGHLFFHQTHKQIPLNYFDLEISEQTFISYNSYYKGLDDIRRLTFNQASPIKSTRVMDYNRWKNTEYFTDFLAPNNFYFLCGVDIIYSNRLIATLTLIREKGEYDFDDKDLLILKNLSPHFAIHLANFFGLKKYQLWTDNFALTTRECDIVELLTQGATNKKIADQLFISVNTVKKHLHNVYEKCEVNSKSQLISRLSNNL